jgi:hypothetical protein
MFLYAFMSWPATTSPYPHITVTLDIFGSFVPSSMELTNLVLNPHPTPVLEG